jgi:hypothetical protein
MRIFACSFSIYFDPVLCRTALGGSAYHGHAEVVEYLVGKGAPVDDKIVSVNPPSSIVSAIQTSPFLLSALLTLRAGGQLDRSWLGGFIRSHRGVFNPAESRCRCECGVRWGGSG